MQPESVLEILLKLTVMHVSFVFYDFIVLKFISSPVIGDILSHIIIQQVELA
jgi:hypothetical protein